MYDFIAEKGTASESDIPELFRSLLNGRDFFVYCQYTTGIACKKYDGAIDDIAHLLEARLFNDSSEIRAVRSGIGKPFIWREIDDGKFKEKLDSSNENFGDRTYSEKQYLDIDATKSNGKSYRFIGGGSYTLPVENAERIELLHYGDYDENGIFTLRDFRIVRILKKGEK